IGENSFDHSGKERLLVREALIECTDRAICHVGNIADRCRFESALVQKLAARCQQAIPRKTAARLLGRTYQIGHLGSRHPPSLSCNKVHPPMGDAGSAMRVLTCEAVLTIMNCHSHYDAIAGGMLGVATRHRVAKSCLIIDDDIPVRRPSEGMRIPRLS